MGTHMTINKGFCFSSHYLLFILVALLMAVGCAQVPITERRGLQLIPESNITSMSLVEYDKILSKSRLSSDEKEVDTVQRVGNKIASAAEDFLRDAGMQEDIKSYQWEFNLIEDDKMVNAWCMPGGKVAVYTGILPYTKDEDGLATVMAHEVGHAIAKHGNERMSQGILAAMGGIVLSVALSNQSSGNRNLYMAAYGAGASLGILLPYSRLHESEADRIGLMVMARAGYDPRAAVPFWERMNNQGKSAQRPPEFLSTHPAPSSRIADIRKYMPDALRYYNPQ